MKSTIRWISLIIVLSLGILTTAQDFPDGLIAYTPHENCENYCLSRILIVDPNTGDTIEIQAPEHSLIYGESLNWSTGQHYLLYWTGDYKAHIADAQTGENIGELEFFRDENLLNRVSYDWHPSLPLIAFIYISDFETETPHYSLHLFDITTQQWTPLIENDVDLRPSSLQWSPDGEKILFRRNEADRYSESDLYIYDVATQNVVNLTNEPVRYGHPDWAQDSQRITYTLDSRVFVMDIETSESEEIYNFEDIRIGGSEWALDDNALLIWTHDTRDEANNFESYLINLADESAELVLEVPPFFSGYDISPDGTAVVYFSSPTNPKNVCILSLITREESCLDGEKAYMVSYPAWGN